MNRSHLLALLTLAVVFTGCRFKGAESFLSTTTPDPHTPAKGDRYAAAGLADATGGLNVKTRYRYGANETSDQRTDPVYNRPAKGSGSQRGELPGGQMAGGFPSNAPMAQRTGS